MEYGPFVLSLRGDALRRGKEPSCLEASARADEDYYKMGCKIMGYLELDQTGLDDLEFFCNEKE